MNLMELQNVLGERVRVTLKENLTAEERQNENEQSAMVAELAKQISINPKWCELIANGKWKR